MLSLNDARVVRMYCNLPSESQKAEVFYHLEIMVWWFGYEVVSSGRLPFHQNNKKFN